MHVAKYIVISARKTVSFPLCFSLIVVLFSLSNKLWKVADFGLTSEGTSSRLVTTHHSKGKPSYRAPELLREQKPGFNSRADIWSLGCIVFELVTDQKAFANDFAVFQYTSSRTDPVTLFGVNHQSINRTLLQLMLNMLDANPKQRPSARGLLKYICKNENTMAKASTKRSHQDAFVETLPSSVSTPKVSSKTTLTLKTLEWSISSGNTNVAKALVGAGIDVCVANSSGQTPLEQAANLGNTELVTLLLENTATVANRQAALRAAVIGRHRDVIKVLLDDGVSFTENDWNLLIDGIQGSLAENGDDEIIDLLLVAWAKLSQFGGKVFAALPLKAKVAGEGWVALVKNPASKEHILSITQTIDFARAFCLVFSPNGKYLAAVGEDCVRVYHTHNGTEVAGYVHLRDLRALCFSRHTWNSICLGLAHETDVTPIQVWPGSTHHRYILRWDVRCGWYPRDCVAL